MIALLNNKWALRRWILVAACLLSVSANAQLLAPATTALPRMTPEAEGVSSEGVRAFFDAFEGTGHELHSLMLLRNGKVVAEGWWDPYAPELTHTMYSTSKTFTATAVGIAAGEGLLRLEDKVISFFPEFTPNPMPAHLGDLNVEHLLSMSVGHAPDPTRAIISSNNWIEAFLATPIVNEPGSTFLYNSMATYMLSAIVTKVTGETVLEYLTPRVFEPLGISGIDWETDPLGNNSGGWGLRLHTEDMAKFGQLYLQDGVWNGERLLPEGWVAAASSFKIQQDPERPAEQQATSDWHQGYCYQIWRCRHDAFRADGAFGQYIVVMPEQDAVLAITSQTSNMQGVLDLVWAYLLPAIQDEALDVNPEASAALQDQLSSLTLPLPTGADAPKWFEQRSGNTYELEANDRNMKQIGFTVNDGRCLVHFEDDRGTYEIPMSAGEWTTSETKRRGPYLVASAQNSLVGLPPFKVASAFRWLSEGVLELTLRYIESPHTETLTCTFSGKEIEIRVVTGVTPPFDIQGALLDD